MQEQELRHSYRRREDRQAHAPRLRSEDGRRRSDGADGLPDARLLAAWRGPKPATSTSRPSAAAARIQGAVVAGTDAAQSAFRGRDQRPGGSRIFYEPLAAGTPTADSCRSRRGNPEPRKWRLARDGISVTWKLKQGVSGTTAGRSPPMTSCSTRNMRQILRRPHDDRQLQRVKVEKIDRYGEHRLRPSRHPSGRTRSSGRAA